jgi:PKD repeat protein
MPFSSVAVIGSDGSGYGDQGWGYGPVWRPVAGGLNDRPVASFTFECSGLTCTFDGSSSSDSDGTIESYGWQFGDGTTGAGATVTHTFENGYLRDVRLIVMDDDAALGTSLQPLDLNQPAVVSFTTACSGLTCTFDPSASFDPNGILIYSHWRFGDGTGDFAIVPPATRIHTYATTGTYLVTLTVTDSNYGESSGSQTVTIGNSPPVASIIWACSGFMCNFNASASSDPDGTITSYAWGFGDTTAASGLAVSHMYAAGGAYKVTLTVTDNSGATSAYIESVAVVPPEMHVGDLDQTSTLQQSSWTAAVTITVHNSGHNVLANAVVSGSWSSGSTASCATNASGQCTVSSAAMPRKTTSVTFTVTDVTVGAFTYAPADNHDPDGDSNGSTVSVTR